MILHEPQVNDFGGAPFAEHDMACAVCWTRSAVLDLSNGRFLPCWSCLREGWQLRKRHQIVVWWRNRKHRQGGAR